MSSTPKFNSKSPTIKRILREASELSTSPSPDYTASPASDSNLFEWHFTLRGPPNSAFENGIYHGRIVLPPTYPLRPPSFRFLTPSGRFETNREICLSISGHHEETWQPAWGIRTALVALRSFMETDAKGQLGGLDASRQARERIAGESVGWVCGSCGRSNNEIMKEVEDAVREKQKEGGGSEVRQEEEVPKELRIGLKEDMERERAAVGAEQGILGDTEAELAEGFVRTVAGNGASDVQAATASSSSYPPARPAQSAPLPTASETTTTQPPVQANGNVLVAHQLQAQRRSNDGVPMWIDRAIAGIVVCLVVMVLKILLGL